MEERKRSSNLQDMTDGLGSRAFPSLLPRVDRTTALAALVAILLVVIGVGTSRGSQGNTGAAARTTESAPSAGAAFVPDAPGLPATGDRARAGSVARLVLLEAILPLRFGRSSAFDRPAAPPDSSDMRSYNGRPIRAVAVLRMRVTAYSPDERSCGASADGITASGYSVLTNGGFLVAADPRVLPLGSLVSIPGYDGGAVVPVLDTGGAIKGNRLDVLYPTHEIAVQWGVQELDVEVWEYADGLPSGFRRVRRPTK